ncbi:hypothetical protein [Nonomuraea sp. NPDC050783]|uniref:amino acid kinase family protein n=1 Tax=Nonomuraea sp. NPDC050783 TaxID=3154634 RepID=UPI00346696DA
MSGTLVVKVGGSCLTDLPPPWWDDLARQARDRRLLLVHGWSGPLRRLDPRHGTPSAFLLDRFGNRSRWTTETVLRDIEKVSDLIADEMTGLLRARGVTLTRCPGSDGLLRAGPGERWWWRDKQLVELDNLVGPIVGVNLDRLPDGSSCLLITPLARDPAGRVVNSDADRAAAALAGAAGADCLVLVTDVPYVLREGTPIRHLNAAQARDFRDRGATGGMRKKLRAAGEALAAGVEQVVLGNASVSELIDGTSGTSITKN